MNKNVIKQLYKKEMLDVLRDKKTVIMMLVVPLIIYPLLMVAGVLAMTKITTGMSSQSYKVGFDFEEKTDELMSLITENEESGYHFDVVKAADYGKALLNGELDAFVSTEEKDGKICYVINYMSSSANSGVACDKLAAILDVYSQLETEKLIEKNGLDADSILRPFVIDYADKSTNEESAGSLMGMIIPFMLIVSLLMGTMYPAIDTTAGEKERGTLETILTMPVTNRELITGKFLTVATIGLVSAFLNVISMAGVSVYFYSLASGMVGTGSINMSKFIPAIIIGILCVLAFAIFISAITMCVCAFAKSYKEANNYITPLTLVVMFASFIAFIPNVVLDTHMALVPVANICLLIRDILLFKYDVTIIGIVLLSNIAYGVLSILFLGKIYNSESVLFGDSATNAQIFEKRSNLKKGGVPSVGDLWFVLAITVVLMIYAGGAAQLKLGYFGVLATQLIILGVPLLAAVYTKKDMKKTFSLRGTGFRSIFGAFFMGIGAIFIGLIITAFTSLIFKESAVNVDISTASLMGDSFVKTLLVVAVAPAICEELMFRGYVLSAISGSAGIKRAIIISACIFGAYHMSLVKFFTTAFLGLVIAIVVWKTESIIPGMIMHFLNNSLAVISMYYPDIIGKILPFLNDKLVSPIEIIVVFAVGMATLFLGYVIICKKSK